MLHDNKLAYIKGNSTFYLLNEDLTVDAVIVAFSQLNTKVKLGNFPRLYMRQKCSQTLGI